MHYEERTCLAVLLNSVGQPQVDEVGYFGMHLDRRLTWSINNTKVHSDLKTIREIISELVTKYLEKLDGHINPIAVNLLDDSETKRSESYWTRRLIRDSCGCPSQLWSARPDNC